MKYLSYLCIVMIFLSFFGCGYYTYYHAIYDITLSEVERPSDTKERYGEPSIVSFEEEGKAKYSFEDEMIKIVWIPTYDRFYFTLTNKTSHSIKIDWDEAVYVDKNGYSKRVTHVMSNYTDLNSPQTPSTIVRNAVITDQIYPADYVYYDYSLGWAVKPLFPYASVKSEHDLLLQAEEYIGKKVQILLPLKIEDVVNEYIFVFNINDVKISH